jgi:surfactin synthase thioesterase subunit
MQVFDGDHFFIHSHKTEFIETLKHDLFQAMTMPAIIEKPLSAMLGAL